MRLFLQMLLLFPYPFFISSDESQNETRCGEVEREARGKRTGEEGGWERWRTGSRRSDLLRWTLIFSVDEAFIKSTLELVCTRVWKGFFPARTFGIRNTMWSTQGEQWCTRTQKHTHTHKTHAVTETGLGSITWDRMKYCSNNHICNIKSNCKGQALGK